MTRVARRLLLCLAAVLLLAGCGLISGMVATENQLQAAGFTNAAVNISQTSPGPGPVMTVTWDSSAETAAGYAAEVGRLLEVVWREAPLRFTILEVLPNNADEIRRPRTFTRVELLQQLGPRPPGLKEQSVEEAGRDAFRGLVKVLLILFVVLGVVAVAIVMIVRRGRRRRLEQQPYAGGWTAPPGTPMWGQPQQPGAWGQQPWGQPPPPGSWAPGPGGQPPVPGAPLAAPGQPPVSGAPLAAPGAPNPSAAPGVSNPSAAPGAPNPPAAPGAPNPSAAPGGPDDPWTAAPPR